MEIVHLTHKECLALIPHWPEVDEQRFRHCYGASKSKSERVDGLDILDVPPILILRTGYILEGIHRTIAAGLKLARLPAYKFLDLADLESFPSSKGSHEHERSNALRAYHSQDLCMLECMQEEVYSIWDLCERVQDALGKTLK